MPTLCPACKTPKIIVGLPSLSKNKVVAFWQKAYRYAIVIVGFLKNPIVTPSLGDKPSINNK
jgi:hypothetical protein